MTLTLLERDREGKQFGQLSQTEITEAQQVPAFEGRYHGRLRYVCLLQ